MSLIQLRVVAVWCVTSVSTLEFNVLLQLIQVIPQFTLRDLQALAD